MKYPDRPNSGRHTGNPAITAPDSKGFELDIHTHTIASGHGSAATITDMAKAAAAKHLKMLGISDHGPATLGGGRISYFRNLSYAQKERLGIRMLYGAEVNILDKNGTLDLDDSILSRLDFVIASMHHPVIKPGSEDENTEAYINAMKNPYVNIIGHCDDTKYPVDYFRLFDAAVKYHVLLEINNSSLSPEGYRGDTRYNDLIILNLSRHYEYPVLFSSDSHGKTHVGDFTYAEKAADLAGIPHSQILNYSADDFLSFISKTRAVKTRQNQKNE